MGARFNSLRSRTCWSCSSLKELFAFEIDALVGVGHVLDYPHDGGLGKSESIRSAHAWLRLADLLDIVRFLDKVEPSSRCSVPDDWLVRFFGAGDFKHRFLAIVEDFASELGAFAYF